MSLALKAVPRTPVWSYARSGLVRPQRTGCKHRPQASSHSLVQEAVQASQAEASSRLPRFYSDTDLPAIAGSRIELSTAESKHATRVLRLSSEALVEVCNGHGQIVSGRLVTQSKAAAHVLTTTQVQQVSWQGPKWELVVACGSLQNSRADYLVEKCTELGAWSFRPLLTERSPGIGWKGVGKATKGDSEQGSSRTARWQRIADAASKQSLRAHNLILQPATTLQELGPLIRAAPTAWVGAAGGSALRDQSQPRPTGACIPGMLIVGPEGDFTMAELDQLLQEGTQLVSLGSHRLRVETAAVAMLSAAQLLVA